jgi:transcriptional regulator with XRE-family HTH domain
MEQFDIGARLRALREMAGYKNMRELATALKANGSTRGLGQTTLRLIERGERVVEARELQDIAELCGVPLAWFTADFSRLEEISEPPRAVIARETRAAIERSRARREDRTGVPRPPLAEGQES